MSYCSIINGKQQRFYGLVEKQRVLESTFQYFIITRWAACIIPKKNVNADITRLLWNLGFKCSITVMEQLYFMSDIFIIFYFYLQSWCCSLQLRRDPGEVHTRWMTLLPSPCCTQGLAHPTALLPAPLLVGLRDHTKRVYEPDRGRRIRK